MTETETLRAYDEERDEWVTFTDYLSEGAEPSLYHDPETEGGWYGIRKLYRDEDGEWRLRFMTHDENVARTRRIMEEYEARTR